MFEECIKTFLKSKLVILVTHQIQYLKKADKILVIHDGKITHEGNFDHLMKSCEDISSFLIAESDEEQQNSIQETKEGKNNSFVYVCFHPRNSVSYF